MTPLFGFDCASPVTPDLIARVTSAYGRPDFVCRYTEQIPGVSTGLTPAEVAIIHGAGMHLLHCYNGILQEELSAGYARGLINGQIAARHAAALSTPQGCALCVDIEAGTAPTAETLRGLAVGIAQGGYTPGFYLDALEGAHTAPVLGALAGNGPAFLWSSEPEWSVWWNTHKTDWYDFTTTPLGARGTLVLAHQYGEGELAGAVDLDLLHPDGLRYLWQAPAPAPVRWTAKRAFGLLPEPKHGTPELIHVQAGASGVDEGGRQTVDGDVWAQLGFGAAGQYYHGWTILDYLEEGN